MNIALELLKVYGTQFSAIGAAVAFLFGAYKYLHDRREAHYCKEFKIFHKLVNELVAPSNNATVMYIDRQAAILFELRNFKRYYPYTLRMLRHLRGAWGSKPEQYPRLIEEINITIEFVESRTGLRQLFKANR